MRYARGDLVHRRWVSGRVAISASEYVVTSPGADACVERCGEDNNDDITLVRWRSAWDAVPPGVDRNRVYRFLAEPADA